MKINEVQTKLLFLAEAPLAYCKQEEKLITAALQS